MDSYLVTSANFAAAPEGATVTAEQLAGCDIAALVSAGHLAPIEAPPDPSGTSAAQLQAAKDGLSGAQDPPQDPLDPPATADQATTPKE